MTHVFHRHLRQTPPTAVSGRGMSIRDAGGKEYLDACGGSEAVEAALKMARQYFVEIGRPQRHCSSPAGRAATATRPARSPSAATRGGAAGSGRS
jgi:adenosylmethionine-8-amino-7-oxononanoate aminotransferase